MNCRSFEWLVADWQAQRLSPKQARRMADHQQACASCAALARAETRMREHWRAATVPDGLDLWPRLAARLETPEVRPVRRAVIFPGFGRSLKPLAAMAVLAAAVSIYGWRQGVGSFPHPPAHGIMQTVHPGTVAPLAPVTLSALSDVAREDPIVDDPAGTQMDQVWAQLHAPGAAGTGNK